MAARQGVWMSVVLAFVIGPIATAQQNAAGNASRAADETAIKQASQALAAAFTAGDAKKLGELFTAEAEYQDDEGVALNGREALAQAYTKMFETLKNAKAEATTDSIRFLGKDSAIEEGTFTVMGNGGLPTQNRYSALYVREGGKWLIAMLKEWQDDEASTSQLESLGWLIGTWESEGPEATASTTYKWVPGKKFIRADFTITPKKEGEAVISGTQVIGVDPAVGEIRSWLFAADGGIGESTWTSDGAGWVVESIGSLADGTPTTATNFIAKTDDNTFTWRSVGRTIAGEMDADTPAVTVKRVAGTGESTAAVR